MKTSNNLSLHHGRTRRGFALLLVGVTLLAASLSAAAPARAAETGVVPDLSWGTSTAEQNKTADAMQDLGAQWARINISWQWVENEAKGTYSNWVWGHYDRAVELARNAGSRVVIMVDQSPPWASGSTDKNMYPRDFADYADFMRTIAARYRGQVEAYEVWNEENLTRFWPTGPDPAAYGRLLKAAYPAVKAGDPDAEVVFGGLSMNDYPYLEEAYAAHPDLGQYFDIMAVHSYSGANLSSPPEEYWYNDNGRIHRDAFLGFQEVRNTMLARGDDKPIWVTEFGWATTSSNWGVSQQLQAEYLRRAYDCFAKYPYVQVATWYNLRNNYWADDADTWEDQLGLFTTNFSRKPAYDAFKTHVANPAACNPYQAGSAPTEPEPTPEPTPVTEPEPTPTDTTEPEEEPAAEVHSSSVLGQMRLRIVRLDRTFASTSQSTTRRVRVRAAGRLKGASRARMTVRLEHRRPGHDWNRHSRYSPRLSDSGRFRTRRIRVRTTGVWRVRAVYRDSAGNEVRERSLKFRL